MALGPLLSRGLRSPALRLVLHVLVGATVATGCDFRHIGREFEALAVAILLLAPAVALARPRPRTALLFALMALGVGSREARSFQILGGCWLAFGLITAVAPARPFPGAGRLFWAAGHAALPFLAGVCAMGVGPGQGPLLLTLALLGVHCGAYPLLGPEEHPAPEPPPGSREWTTAAVREGVATTLTMIGLACLAVWLWTYGAGASGLVLATPGGVALLWLGTGWTLDSRDTRQHRRWRQEAVVAWCSVILAIGAATYL